MWNSTFVKQIQKLNKTTIRKHIWTEMYIYQKVQSFEKKKRTESCLKTE